MVQSCNVVVKVGLMREELLRGKMANLECLQPRYGDAKKIEKTPVLRVMNRVFWCCK